MGAGPLFCQGSSCVSGRAGGAGRRHVACRRPGAPLQGGGETMTNGVITAIRAAVYIVSGTSSPTHAVNIMSPACE